MSGMLMWMRDFRTNLRGFDWSELRYVSACGYWPMAVYIVIFVGSSLMLLVLCSLVLLPGLRESWHAVQERSSALAFERAALHHQLVSTTAINTSMASVCVQCPVLHRELRAADPMPVVLDRLRGAAAARGVLVAALRPQQTWHQSPLRAYEIDVQLNAAPQQLAGLMNDIEVLPFALAVKQADWQLASAHARLTLLLLVDDSAPVRVPAEARAPRMEVAGLPRSENQGARVAGTEQGNDWQRVAFIQRGNRYLEVLRDARGDIRRRAGDVTQVSP